MVITEIYKLLDTDNEEQFLRKCFFNFNFSGERSVVKNTKFPSMVTPGYQISTSVFS